MPRGIMMSAMGRFGGGWQWEVGIQANKNWSYVIVNLLVCSVILDFGRRPR